MDTETARTFATYALCLVLISLVVDFGMRIYAPTSKLNNKFLAFTDKYSWVGYLVALTAECDFFVKEPETRANILVLIAVVSLVLSLYRYKKSLTIVRQKSTTILE